MILASCSYAQQPEVLNLMNGKVLEVYQFNDTAYTDLRFEFDRNFFRKERLHQRQRQKAGRFFDTALRSPKADAMPVIMRSGKMQRDDVFSLLRSDGTERIFYYQDPEFDDAPPPESMRSFVLGERDARLAVSGRGWLYAGFIAGLAGGYFSEMSIWALAVPPLFALTANIPTIRIPERAIHDLRYQHDNDFAAGFEAQARSRNIRQGLLGSVGGTAIGLLLYAVIDHNR